MYELEFGAKQATLQLDTEKKVNQITTSQQGADAKQQQKIAHKEQDQSQKAAAKAQDVAMEASKKQIALEAEREKLRMKKADKQKAQATNEE
jgi:hypothetical protein